MDGRFSYQLGDLVSFTQARQTEEYVEDFDLTGVVIKQRFVFTADNKYLVQTPEKDYWVPRPSLTLLSRAKNTSQSTWHIGLVTKVIRVGVAQQHRRNWPKFGIPILKSSL